MTRSEAPVENERDAHWMELALRLAEKGRGRVSPNPVVGAVVVNGSHEGREVAGRGWHREFGGAHAEVFALREAGAAARGGTLYCTLEPCNHTGKTPPCSEAIIAAGIRRVVLGARDPNPLAAGGVAALCAAGIEVTEGVLAAECARANLPFFKNLATGLPYVALKWAMTLDGKLASASGDSKWITGEVAREQAHRLRTRHDAVLVGIGTLLTDDPRLDARISLDEEFAQPRRIVLDSSARTPLSARLWDVPGGGDILIACAIDADAGKVNALKSRGAEIVSCQRRDDGKVDVADLLRQMPGRHVLSLLVEGGSAVLGAFVDAHLADAAHVFLAPKILGGAASIPAVGGKRTPPVAEAWGMRDTHWTVCGDDFLVEGTLSEWGGYGMLA